MTREEAEQERARLAEEHPEATWLVAEPEPGKWAVVKVGLKPADSAGGQATEAKPKPPTADDPRSAQDQLFPPWSAGI